MTSSRKRVLAIALVVLAWAIFGGVALTLALSRAESARQADEGERERGSAPMSAPERHSRPAA